MAKVKDASAEATAKGTGAARRGGPRTWTVLVGKRLGFFAVALFGVITLSFLLVGLAPGDPARVIAGSLATEQQIAAIRADLGLDLPLWQRYVDYMGGLLRGDLGTSYYTDQPIADEIGQRLPATLELVALSVAVAAIIGTALGVFGAYHRRRAGDRAARTLIGFFQAVPDFFLGLLLIYFLFFVLGIAPAPSGQLDIVETAPPRATGLVPVDAMIAGDWATAGSALSHLVLPVLTLGLAYAAYFGKTARNTVGKALQSQQVQFARALGLPERTVLRYAFVQARTGLVTYAGVVFASLLGGEAIVETIFSWSGLGQWALEGIVRLDLPVVQGMVLVAGAITLLIYTLLDLVVAWLDPRISYG